MKIIFSAFDNVLNSECYFLKRNRNMKDLRLIDIHPKNDEDKFVQWHMYNLDLDNIEVLKEITDETNAKIVVTSNWKDLDCFKEICIELIKLGLPIIDATKDDGYDRGTGIKNYIEKYDIDTYAILDDQIFEDFDSELIKHLVMMEFNASGLRKEDSSKVKKLLKNV